jgi:hypothetical protein
MKVIIYDSGNGISVVYPTGELSIEEVQTKDCPEGSLIIDDSELPSRDFRNAWELVDGAVAVNFAKAQDLTKARLRAEREPLLVAQDVAFQRNLETGADNASVIAEKQRLRDITNLVDTATTLEELKSLSCDKPAQVEVIVEAPAVVVEQTVTTEGV